MRDYCDAQAGFWLNSKFWSKFSRKPLSGIEDQKASPPISENFRFGMSKVYSGIPPLPHFRKLQIWDDQSLLQNTPPFQKTSDLGWPKFTPKYPPPPISENFRFGMTKVYSGIPPPPFRKTLDLGWPKFTPEYPPPPNWKLSESPSPRVSEYRELLHVETLSNPDNY